MKDVDYIDFNEIYNLQKDPVLPDEEFLQKDDTLNSENIEITIQILQEWVSDIQLIPPVPQDVKKIFSKSKKLFVIGYFDRYFFSISEHYALLSIESALKNKFYQVFEEDKDDGYRSLQDVINKLIEQGEIDECYEQYYDNWREWRNEYSHLTEPVEGDFSEDIFVYASNAINLLWHEP